MLLVYFYYPKLFYTGLYTIYVLIPSVKYDRVHFFYWPTDNGPINIVVCTHLNWPMGIAHSTLSHYTKKRRKCIGFLQYPRISVERSFLPKFWDKSHKLLHFAKILGSFWSGLWKAVVVTARLDKSPLKQDQYVGTASRKGQDPDRFPNKSLETWWLDLPRYISRWLSCCYNLKFSCNV
jgi:hypothetical protein